MVIDQINRIVYFVHNFSSPPSPTYYHMICLWVPKTTTIVIVVEYDPKVGGLLHCPSSPSFGLVKTSATDSFTYITGKSKLLNLNRYVFHVINLILIHIREV